MDNDLFKPMQGLKGFMDFNTALITSYLNKIRSIQAYWAGIYRYLDDFTTPYWIAQDAFFRTEQRKVTQVPLEQTMMDYWELFQFNMQVVQKGYDSTVKAMNEFHQEKLSQAMQAWFNTITGAKGDDIVAYTQREARLLEKTIYEYPKAIRDIGPHYGFHFEENSYIKVAQTDRFDLYQVLPTEPGVRTRKKGKPVMVIHPYVLGPNIVCFLPDDRKSYVHAFANTGTPTYVRIMKDIDDNPAVQTMTGEEDCLDTKYFCEKLRDIHNRPVTLNGFCQGGFIAACEILSGELDGLVDAFVTCVSPMDGTQSKSLVEYLEHLPPRFRDLGYAVKTLPNGNRVVDGKVMSWVYKLKSMESEAPVFAFYRDMKMFDKPDIDDVKISRTAAALNNWLIYERTDLPEAITQMSFKSYTIPVTDDGTLPVSLFGRKLNFKRIQEKGIKFLICYAARDNLVERETAVAPAKHIEVEITEFPKGHGAIGTSWSHPDSECALHKRFGPDGKYRGPVRFHLDIEAGKD